MAISLAHRSGEGGGILLALIVFTVGYRRGRGRQLNVTAQTSALAFWQLDSYTYRNNRRTVLKKSEADQKLESLTKTQTILSSPLFLDSSMTTGLRSR